MTQSFWCGEILHWTGAIERALAGLCRKVTYVGHSASLVQMWLQKDKDIEARVEHSTWIATKGVAAHRLRTATPGRLSALEARYNREAVDEYARLITELQAAKAKRRTELKREIVEKFGESRPVSQRPPFSLPIGYRKSEPATLEKISSTVFDSNFVVLTRTEGRSVGLESTLTVMEAARAMLMSMSPGQPPPEWISGHAADGSPRARPHLALFPLPHVGREFADGHLLGIGIAIPRGIDAEEQSACLDPILFNERLGRPRESDLRITSDHTWSISMESREQPPTALSSPLSGHNSSKPLGHGHSNSV